MISPCPTMVPDIVQAMGDGDVHPDLQQVWLFSGCSQTEIRKITKAQERVTVPAGTLLVEQGEPGLLFFVVLAGTASVVRDGRAVTSLGPNDYFGELALLDKGPRSASVTSDTEMTLLVIQRHNSARPRGGTHADSQASTGHGHPPPLRGRTGLSLTNTQVVMTQTPVPPDHRKFPMTSRADR